MYKVELVQSEQNKCYVISKGESSLGISGLLLFFINRRIFGALCRLCNKGRMITQKLKLET